MPYADPAQQRAARRRSMAAARSRRRAAGATGGTSGAPLRVVAPGGTDGTADVTSISGCQRLLGEAIASARDGSVDAASRARLLTLIATAGSRLIADAALESRVQSLEDALDDEDIA